MPEGVIGLAWNIHAATLAPKCRAGGTNAEYSLKSAVTTQLTENVVDQKVQDNFIVKHKALVGTPMKPTSPQTFNIRQFSTAAFTVTRR
jgi:hypothetical protein